MLPMAGPFQTPRPDGCSDVDVVFGYKCNAVLLLSISISQLCFGYRESPKAVGKVSESGRKVGGSCPKGICPPCPDVDVVFSYRSVLFFVDLIAFRISWKFGVQKLSESCRKTVGTDVEYIHDHVRLGSLVTINSLVCDSSCIVPYGPSL